MADLHEALKWLSPIDWVDVPQDDLNQLVEQATSAGELICNSVPPLPNGTPASSSSPLLTNPNAARSAADIRSSEARPQPPHTDHEQLRSAWGKPVKIKDNPLTVSIYKMAGRDRHGAWFARRSIHEGIGFDKFKRALQREFPHSLSVSGGPGAGAVRGIAADRLVEQKKLVEGGRVQVYQLSAQFPGPTAAREFSALVMTTDDALSSKSGAEIDGETQIPRHYMILSKPVTHPDISNRSGYVKGQYESVEMIREILLSRTSIASKSTPDPHKHSHDVGRDQSATVAASGQNNHDHGPSDTTYEKSELNPVEWTMITRSDPGGGIPRFLVDRGTPDAMLSDLTRFFDWACAFDEVPDADASYDEQAAQNSGTADAQNAESITSSDSNPHTHHPSHETHSKHDVASTGAAQQTNGGILASIGHTIQSGIEAYAPAAVTQQVHHYLHIRDSSSDISDDGSSTVSFLSATEHRQGDLSHERHLSNSSEDDPTVMPSEVSSISRVSMSTHERNHHDKDADKTAKQRVKADEKLAKKRDEEEDRYRKATEKDDGNLEKARERRDGEIKRLEEQHRRAVEKLNQKEAKERKKADDRRRKKDEANKVALVSRQRDDYQTQAELARRENTLLTRQVEDLQREVTLLTQVVGNLGGDEALMQLREQLANPSKSTATSLQSGQSIASSGVLSPASSRLSLAT